MRVPTRLSRDPDFKTLPAEVEADLGPAAQNLPMVAVVGRPNVGKSTLFNRLIGRRRAVVHDRPGVTRDRNIAPAEWDDVPFLCVDTGGYETELEDPLIEGVLEQVRMAVAEADVIILIFAAGEWSHPADESIVRLLRPVDKPVFVVVNKCDNETEELASAEFYRFGFEKIHPLSAMHGRGVADLMLDVLVALRGVEAPAHPGHAHEAIALAIVGRQNVGKSTLLNQLAGGPRVITSDLPGTTRDAIDLVVEAPGGRRFTLIDTAGIRRRGKIERGIERLSVGSAMFSMRRADVAALVLDAVQGLTDQDAHIAGYCEDYGLATIVLVNKWDLVEKDHRTADAFTDRLQREWPFLKYAPVLYLSALTGQRTRRVFELAQRVHANTNRRIATHELNERLEEWVGRKPPHIRRNRRPKIRFITQTGVGPPTFTLFVNDPTLIHFSYRRYLTNRLRETYDFEGAPIRLQLRLNRPRPDDPRINVD